MLSSKKHKKPQKPQENSEDCKIPTLLLKKGYGVILMGFSFVLV